MSETVEEGTRLQSTPGRKVTVKGLTHDGDQTVFMVEPDDGAPCFRIKKDLIDSLWYVLREAKPATLLEGSEHYKKSKYQPLEVLLEWQKTWPEDIRFHLGCVLKYLGRMGKKDEVLMELKKMKHYCEEAIRVMELASK